MSRGCCVALPGGAIGYSVVCDCGVPDHTHLLFFHKRYGALDFALMLKLVT